MRLADLKKTMIKYMFKPKKLKRSRAIENKSLIRDYEIPNLVEKFDQKVEELTNMGRKVIGEKSLKLEDGKHEGVITSIEFRDEPYAYTDIVIKEKVTGLDIKCGVPTKITEDTALGLILENFGVAIEVNKEYDIEETIKGKVVFITATQKTERGTFAKIVPSSLKPIKK